jgi:hypothetical protein
MNAQTSKERKKKTGLKYPYALHIDNAALENMRAALKGDIA